MKRDEIVLPALPFKYITLGIVLSLTYGLLILLYINYIYTGSGSLTPFLITITAPLLLMKDAKKTLSFEIKSGAIMKISFWEKVITPESKEHCFQPFLSNTLQTPYLKVGKHRFIIFWPGGSNIEEVRKNQKQHKKNIPRIQSLLEKNFTKKRKTKLIALGFTYFPWIVVTIGFGAMMVVDWNNWWPNV